MIDTFLNPLFPLFSTKCLQRASHVSAVVALILLSAGCASSEVRDTEGIAQSRAGSSSQSASSDPAELNDRGEWAVCQSELDGKPMFTRINVSAKQLMGDKRFSNQMVVCIPLQTADNTGMPNPSELEQIGAFEDALIADLNTKKTAVLAAVTTCDGLRNYFFYTGAPEVVRQAANDAKSKVKSHELQFSTRPDPTWNLYKNLEPPAK